MHTSFINNDMENVTKVTMNLSDHSLKDVEEIKKISPTTTRTATVVKALRAYLRLLELQKEGGVIMIEEKNGKKKRLELLT